jgi:hypothetical protein
MSAAPDKTAIEEANRQLNGMFQQMVEVSEAPRSRHALQPARSATAHQPTRGPLCTTHTPQSGTLARVIWHRRTTPRVHVTPRRAVPWLTTTRRSPVVH